MVQERAEEIVEVFFRAIQQGDWRAGAALLERVYGKPAEKVEVSQPQSVPLPAKQKVVAQGRTAPGASRSGSAVGQQPEAWLEATGRGEGCARARA